MTEKIYLEGSIKSLSRYAPAEAWVARSGPVNRPEDVWIEGDPSALVTGPGEWFSELKSRVEPCSELFGLRARFVLSPTTSLGDLTLFDLLKATLDGLSWRYEGLFLHGELTSRSEPGLYLAWDNRPPALSTQLWLKRKSEVEGSLPDFAPPVHLNLLLHHTGMGYNELWNDGTMNWFLEQLRQYTQPALKPRDVKMFSLARSNLRECGMSAGLEQVVREVEGEMSVGTGVARSAAS